MENLTPDFAKEYSRFFAEISAPETSANQEAFSLHTGTTIIASFYDSGRKIIMAGDRKVSRMAPGGGVGAIAGREARKIYPVGKWHCFGGAGIGTFVFRLGQEVAHINKRWKQDRGYPLSGFGIAGILRQFCAALTMKFGAPNSFIVCTTQPKPAIFQVEAIHTERKDAYAIVGSGSTAANPEFDKSWRFDMSEDQAIDLTIEALCACKRFDVGSGWDEDSPPIVVLLKDELVELSEEAVIERIEKFEGTRKSNRTRRKT